MDFLFTSELEEMLQDRLAELTPLAGGSICQAFRLDFASGARYFLKSKPNADEMFRIEANNLNLLAATNTICIPQVILCSKNYLLLQFIENGKRDKKFFRSFARDLAALHRVSSTKFGLDYDNFIGMTVQKNTPTSDSWATYYTSNRLGFQLELLKKNKLGGTSFWQDADRLLEKVPEILKGSEEAPSLIHGDLWAQNFLCGHDGKAVLIDPAIYFGHREAELAMTKLFGGFPDEFYLEYQQAFPLPANYEYRENLYRLYHVLNHANMFGSGYLSEAHQLIKYYL